MTELQSLDRAAALQTIADSPATLEFRAIALERESMIFYSGAGLLLADARGILVGATGAVSCGDLRRLYESKALRCELLADESACDALRNDIAFAPATILTLSAPWSPPAGRVERLVVRPFQPNERPSGLPETMCAELDHWPGRNIFAGFVKDRVAAVAYSAWWSETFADVAIETLSEFRGRGIGAQVAAALIDDVLRLGKTPVWGATDDNRASLRLAEKLGFCRPSGRLYVADRLVFDAG